MICRDLRGSLIGSNLRGPVKRVHSQPVRSSRPLPSNGRAGRARIAVMTEPGLSSSDRERRVLPFRRGRPGASRPLPPLDDDLAKYEHGGETDDYRHRMIVNAAAFLFVITLIGVGLWLAETMTQLRRNQDCVLSGRRNCVPVEVNRDHF
jgi:hypothetical protein